MGDCRPIIEYICHGMKIGSLKILYLCYDANKQIVTVGVETVKTKLQIHATKTGVIHIYNETTQEKLL